MNLLAMIDLVMFIVIGAFTLTMIVPKLGFKKIPYGTSIGIFALAAIIRFFLGSLNFWLSLIITVGILIVLTHYLAKVDWKKSSIMCSLAFIFTIIINWIIGYLSTILA